MNEPLQPHLPDCAVDAIPEDGVLLHNAFNWFCGQFGEIPNVDNLLADIAGKDFVERSMKLLQAELPEAYETDNFLWRIDAAAHVLLREALSSARLKAYIRDPDAAETLKVGWEGWFPPWWDSKTAKVGTGPVRSPYVHPADPDNFGPLTATLRGLRRPVFFKTDEFRQWAEALVARVTGEAGRPEGRVRDVAAYKFTATIEAIEKLWERGRPPGTLSATQRDKKINDLLVKTGNDPVSAQTIRRALAYLRRRRS